MDMETSPSLDFDRICRVCLLEHPILTSLFVEERGVVPLSMRYMSCTSLEATRDDKLPGKLCQSCLFQIDSWYKFKDLSERSEKVLNRLAGKSEVEFGSIFQIQAIGREIKEMFDPIQTKSAQVKIKKEAEAEENIREKIGFSECNFCLKYFSDHSLAAHKSKYHGREMKKRSKNRNTLRALVKIIENSNPAERIIKGEEEVNCAVCDAEFISKRELKEHVLSEHGIAERSESKANHVPDNSLCTGYCEECGIKFPNDSELLVHKYMDHTVKRQSRDKQCLDCLAIFQTTKNLYEHISEEHGYRCSDCNVGFATKEELANHVAEKGDHKMRYSCDHCDLIFEEEDELVKHMKQKTQCGICNKVCAKPRSLANHMLSKHNIGDRGKHQCELCGKEFPYISSLRYHRRTHGEKSIICNICGRGFHFMCNYNVHLELHHSRPDDKVVCELCGGLFPKCKMRDHLLRHSVPAFACTHCGKSFRQKNQLRKHLIAYHKMTHRCPLCSKVFATLYDLQIHSESEHQEVSFRVELEAIDP